MLHRHRPKIVIAAITVAASALVVTPSSAKDRGAPLAPRHEEWLKEVALIMTEQEESEFLALEKDYQRDGFIEKFWEARDPEPDSPRNRYKEDYYARRDEAMAEYGNTTEDRARILIVQGPPRQTMETDCGMLLWPLELWYYPYSDTVKQEFGLIFYQPSATGPFRLWDPSLGYEVLMASGPAGRKPDHAPQPYGDGGTIQNYPSGESGFEEGTFFGTLERYCGIPRHQLEMLIKFFIWSESVFPMGVHAAHVPPRPDAEWLRTFRTYSTDLPEDTTPFDATLSVEPVGRDQNRAVVQAMVTVEAPGLVEAARAAGAGLSFRLTGEILIEDRLHDSFRYQFDLPLPERDDVPLPLVFERPLRPGEYTYILRLEDLEGGRQTRLEELVVVPPLDALAATADDGGEPGGGEASAAGEAAPPSIELVPPAGDLLSGAVRVEALARGDTGAIASVTFLVDGEAVLTKRRPPYSVEVRLGELPRPHQVRAVARNETGDAVATDEILINPPPHRFAVHLVEPRPGPVAGGSLRVRAETVVPEGRSVDRLELFLDDRRVGVIEQPPWAMTVPVPVAGPPPVFVQAVAHLDDGTTAEDVVSLSAGELGEELEVDVVELYTTVLDRDGHPVPDLSAGDFRVLEDGQPQSVVRFEPVAELPLHVALLVDTSASMEESLPDVRTAALRFFQDVLTDDDRAAVITFSDRPRMLARFTGETDRLAVALANLRAERSTRFYDAVVYGLEYFQGLPGRRALLVLSDGEDEGSRFSIDEAVDYARFAGVAVYTVSFGGLNQRLDGDRYLQRFARETGGRSFSLRDASQLDEVYRTIEQELRCQYLLVYHPPAGDGDGLRSVTVEMVPPGLEARTITGYYP